MKFPNYWISLIESEKPLACTPTLWKQGQSKSRRYENGPCEYLVDVQLQMRAILPFYWRFAIRYHLSNKSCPCSRRWSALAAILSTKDITRFKGADLHLEVAMRDKRSKIWESAFGLNADWTDIPILALACNIGSVGLHGQS